MKKTPFSLTTSLKHWVVIFKIILNLSEEKIFSVVAIRIPLINSEGEHFQVLFFSCNFIFYYTKCLWPHPDSRQGSSRQVAHLAFSACCAPAPRASLNTEQGVGSTPLFRQACLSQKCWELAALGQLSTNGKWKTMGRCFSPAILGG